MKTLFALINRNRKLFFRDKGMLFSSLITPIILIVLYGTFLANVYKQSFESSLPEFLDVSGKLINGTVASQLAAALLAVSCVTVTFCVNLTMIQDRANGSRKDFNVAPVKKPVIYLGYFFSTVLNSLMVNLLALFICLVYVRMMGWYMSAGDIVLLVIDIVVLILFGTVLSSIVCYPLKTQGQMSAVGTIVSAGYGFICGAYMPISNFSEGLQKGMSYLPSTYGTSMLKNHMLRGVFEEMEAKGFPDEVVTGIADSLDCNPVFRNHVVTTIEMLVIMIGAVLVLGVVYLMMTAVPEKNQG
ncbi:MAG: ABC transporter permease [Dorea sp.]|nr:ABC transporter permease [Dorea sp.]MDY2813304.1 ABC transporter permease [Dorea sp.]